LARGLLDDNQTPYLWSDAELTAYLNKSINELCEEAELLKDSTTTAICQIAIVAGKSIYSLDERVLKIKRARLVIYDTWITRRTTEFMDRYYRSWDSVLTSPGTPAAFIEDQNTGKITIYPVPDADDTLKMTVVRLPLVQMSTTTLTASPEVHMKYHFDLLDGILWRAYSKQDAETYDPKKANTHRALWMTKKNEIMLKIINDNDIDDHFDQTPDYLEDLR